MVIHDERKTSGAAGGELCCTHCIPAKAAAYFYGELIWLSKPCWSSVYSRYEPNIAGAIKAHLPRGGTFWDVGANVGLLSLFASKIAGPKGHIISFEPSPEVLALLRRNIEGETNIKVLPYGIGNADTVRSFAMQGISSAASFVEEVTAINRSFLPDQPIEQVTVTMRKLDTVLSDGALCPALVKVDVEGFELEVLKGADHLLSSIHPKLLIEIHPPQLTLSGGSEDELFQMLREHQYHYEIIDRSPNSL
jgi:FkbM family methyltransferase